MSTVTTEKHIHEFERMQNKNYYRCIHPRCFYTTHKERIKGKEVVCHNCKRIFVVGLDKRVQQLKNKFMRCDFCIKSPKAVMAEMAQNLVNETIKELEESENKQMGVL